MYEEKEAIFPEISLKKEEKIIPVEIKPKEKQSEKGSARSLLILPRTGGGKIYVYKQKPKRLLDR